MVTQGMIVAVGMGGPNPGLRDTLEVACVEF